MKVSEKKRLAIIEAAKKEFIEHGYISANMDKVCELAEVSKRTLYRHFENKHTLFTEAIEHIFHCYNDKLSLSYSSTKPLDEQLKEYLSNKLKVFSEYFGVPLVRMIISEFLRKPEFGKGYVSLLRRRDDELEEWIRAAINDGKLIKSDIRSMTKMFMSLYQGHFLWPQLVTEVQLTDSDARKEQIDGIVRLFLAGYQLEKQSNLQ